MAEDPTGAKPGRTPAKSATRKSGTKPGSGSPATGWLLLVYKVPSEPSRVRVSVWRELKRLGGVYLQQAACIFPALPDNAKALQTVRERIASLGGTSWYFEVPPPPDEEHQQLIASFQRAAAKEYAEIVEECETKFVKEIEFERFRSNYTFEEAEEIRQDLEKIRRWFGKVIARDWFGAPGRDEVTVWLEKCEALLEEFEEEVYRRTKDEDVRSSEEA
jgi:hypothetical protein